jgi:hypothetical protein
MARTRRMLRRVMAVLAFQAAALLLPSSAPAAQAFFCNVCLPPVDVCDYEVWDGACWVEYHSFAYQGVCSGSGEGCPTELHPISWTPYSL